MKKKLLYMVLSLACTFILPGCQSTTSGTEDGIIGKTQENKQEGKIKLRYSLRGSTNEKDAVTKSREVFTAQDPNIEVKIIHTPVDYEAKLGAMIAGGEESDLASLRDYFVIPLAESGKLYNILDLIDQDPDIDRKDYLDFVYRYYSPDVAHGLNMATELFVMLYNKKTFENTGVEGLPSSVEDALTTDEFTTLARKLTLDSQGRNATGPDFDPTNIVQYGFMFDFGVQQYMGAVYSNEGSHVSEDGVKWTLNQPQSVEALQTISDLVNVYHVTPNPSELKAPLSLAAALQTDKAAVIWVGVWIALDLGLGDTELDADVLPVFREGVYATCSAQGTVGIFKSTQHPEKIFKLWKWLMDPGNSIDLYAPGLWMPLLTDYYQEKDLFDTWTTVAPAHPSGYMGSHMEVVLDGHVATNPSGYVKNYTEINALVTPALESVFLGNESVQGALGRIVLDVEKLLKRRYDK